MDKVESQHLLIFDFDGVIIDSKQLQKKALLESYQLVYKSGEPCYEEFFSHSGDALPNIFLKMGLSSRLVPAYQEVCRRNIGLIEIFDGIVDLLYEVKRWDFKCALCTGKDRSRTLDILDHFDLNSFFDMVVCSDDVDHPKPHPQSLLRIMSRLNIENTKTTMIGDSPYDILSAKRASVKSIAVTWGDTTWTNNQEQADLIVNTIEELRTSILTSTTSAKSLV